MKKIIIHWTAGTNQPNSTDFQHYHYLVNGDGVVVKGKFPVSANEVCRSDARGNALYAAHCGGGNTGAIGVAMCGMANEKYPLRQRQCEAAFKLCAELSKQYNIPITKLHIMTHYEFGLTHHNTSSAGKIDITKLSPYPNVKQKDVGDFIRNKIQWYYSKL